MPAPTESPAWQRLAESRKTLVARGLSAIVDGKSRFSEFSLRLGDLLFDFSHQEIDADVVDNLVALAEHAGVPRWRERLFAGDLVNATERLPALHMALRAHAGDDWNANGTPITDRVRTERARCYRFARAAREQRHRGVTGLPITDIVNIGIGASHTGPQLLCDALDPLESDRIRLHFVSNADGADLRRVLQVCRPETTLFLVISKTFTTQEILLNARTARDWVTGELGDDATAAQFAAVTAHPDRAAEFGIAGERTFATWDWIGDRFAVWGATGLTAMIALGRKQFDDLLEGAREIDEHFRDAPLAENIPVMLALIGIWNRNFGDARSHCVLPYAEGLRLLPAYLQQLMTESLAKCIDRDGRAVTYSTGPTVWGMQATDGQYAFHQLLHQGTDSVMVDIVGFREPAEGPAHHHPVLLANLISQVESLVVGDTAATGPHCAGGRSSTVLAFNQLTPRSLGRLLALYEHQVFVQGIVWNLNPFDKWGTELGKHLAQPILDHLTGGPKTKHDTATDGLIGYFTGT